MKSKECLGRSCRLFEGPATSRCFHVGFLPRCSPSLKEAKREELLQENLELRMLLWGTHPCSGKYGDDGELQCADPVS